MKEARQAGKQDMKALRQAPWAQAGKFIVLFYLYILRFLASFLLSTSLHVTFSSVDSFKIHNFYPSLTNRSTPLPSLPHSLPSDRPPHSGPLTPSPVPPSSLLDSLLSSLRISHLLTNIPLVTLPPAPRLPSFPPSLLPSTSL